MKLRPLLFFFFMLPALCWLLVQKQTSFDLLKKNPFTTSQGHVFQGSSRHSSPGLIAQALDRCGKKKLPPLPYPAAPLESLSEQESLDFPGARVVEFAELDGPEPHQKLRLRILETHLKNPYLRTEEVLDTDSGNLLGRLEMAADELLITLPPEKNPQQFLAEFGSQGLFITPISSSLSLYALSLNNASLTSLPEALERLQEGAFSGSFGEPNYIAHTSKRPKNYGYSYQWGLWKDRDSSSDQNFKARYEHYFYKWSHGQLDFFTAADSLETPPLARPIASSLYTKTTSAYSSLPTINRDAALSWMETSMPSKNSSTKRGINALEAWDVRTDASSVIVGLIDSGIRYTHENLKKNIWKNPNPNPQKRDLHGYNAEENSGNIWDAMGHGTHCAGVIGGEASDIHLGISGIAWRVQLMGCKCANEQGVISEDNIVRAIDYAKEHGATILNCSLGWAGAESSIAMAVELQSLHDRGIILVAAAGNDGVDNDASLFKSYPASYTTQLDNIVSVAATDYVETDPDQLDAPNEQEGLASFSNYGATSVSLAAPGTFILSSYNTSDSAYAFLSGTSMATPYVTGALALMKAEFPNATYRELIQHLIETTDTLPSLDGKMIGGRLNLARALKTKPTTLPLQPAPIFSTTTSSSTKNWKFFRGPCKRNDWINKNESKATEVKSNG